MRPSHISRHRPLAAAGSALEPPVTLRHGTLSLDPPGIELALADVFPPA